MASFSSQNARLFAIADAQHLLSVIDSFWPLLEKFGATPGDKKLLIDRLAKAIASNDAEDEGEKPTIAQLRPALNDQLGALRGSASLIAYSQREVNVTAEAELKVKGKFPESDVALEKFWRGMPKAIKKYATQLSHRGFSKDDQERLVRDMAEFTRAMKARARRRSAGTASARARDQIFEDLRWSTSCLRRIGRVALRNSPERTKLDRVAAVARASKPAPAEGTAAGGSSKGVSAPVEAGAPSSQAAVASGLAMPASEIVGQELKS